MTTKHRNRLLLAATVALLVIGASSATVASAQGVGAALVVFGVGALIVLVILAVAWYVLASNDRRNVVSGQSPR